MFHHVHIGMTCYRKTVKSERKDVHFKDVEIFILCGSFTNVASLWYKSLRLNSRVLVRSVPVRSVTTGSITGFLLLL